jgi:hypothetical protein
MLRAAVLLAAAMAGGSDATAASKAGLSNTAYAIDIGPGRDVLVLRGELTRGVAAAFRSVLAAAPGTKRIDLDSVGGLLIEAQQIAEIIRSRGLDTNVTGVCYSACTHVLLGGVRRTAAKRGRIGFHSAYTIGDDEATPDTHAPYAGIIARSFYEKAKLPQAFIAHIFATPSTRMWTPSRKELIEANVLTTPGAPD